MTDLSSTLSNLKIIREKNQNLITEFKLLKLLMPVLKKKNNPPQTLEILQQKLLTTGVKLI